MVLMNSYRDWTDENEKAMDDEECATKHITSTTPRISRRPGRMVETHTPDDALRIGLQKQPSIHITISQYTITIHLIAHLILYLVAVSRISRLTTTRLPWQHRLRLLKSTPNLTPPNILKRNLRVRLHLQNIARLPLVTNTRPNITTI